MKEKLIVYFSWSGNTRKIVKAIEKEFHYDMEEITKKTPYSSDYNQCAYVEAKEEVEKGIHPEINPLPFNANDYEEILLFFPIWWYTFPMPVATFLESIKDYKGKVTFFMNSYTNDPQYVINSLRDAKRIAPSVNIVEGLFNKSIAEHLALLRKEN